MQTSVYSVYPEDYKPVEPGDLIRVIPVPPAPMEVSAPRRGNVSTREKGPRGGRNGSLHTKLPAALVGDVGFQGTQVLAVCLSLQQVQEI